MDKIFDIASSISTPLGLGGFFAAVVFYIFKQVLTKDLLRQLTSSHSADVIKLIIERLFVLALIAMILGFIAYLVTKLTPQIPAETDVLQAPAAAGATDVASAPVAQTIPTCRHSSNGVERWGQEQNINFDSGWKKGGSNPQEFCAGKMQERRSQYPDREVTMVGTPGEQSKEEFYRQFYYRYACTVRERWDPVYVLAPNPRCT
jgi:uncharacterized membrane protein